MPTISQYYGSLRDTSISGVTNLDNIPAQISTAILPCKYIRYQGSQIQISTLTNTLGLPTYNYDIVIVIEPVLQNTNIANQTLCMEIAEYLESYFESIDDILTVNIAFEINIFSNVPFWTLITEIEILGG